MVHYIKIGGKERPVSFGYEVGYSYEMETDGNYNALVYKIVDGAFAAREALSANDLARASGTVGVKPLSDVVYFGMKHAHRQEGLEIDFSVEDVAGWIFGSQKTIQACITALMESLPRPSEDDAPDVVAKKKIVARPGSTGKGLSKRLR